MACQRSMTQKNRERERRWHAKEHDPINKVSHNRSMQLSVHQPDQIVNISIIPMDPNFDLATYLSQADAFLLPIQTPHMPAISVRQSKGKPW